jgi:hypothetical protein
MDAMGRHGNAVVMAPRVSTSHGARPALLDNLPRKEVRSHPTSWHHPSLGAAGTLEVAKQAPRNFDAPARTAGNALRLPAAPPASAGLSGSFPLVRW